MKRVVLVAGSGYACLLAVVGCSGSATTPSVEPLSVPRAAVSDAPARRPHNGDRYAYAGTMTQTFVRTLPSPMPKSKTVTRVTVSVVVKGHQTFAGTPGLYDFVTAEKDATQLQTTRSRTDDYEGVSSPSRRGAYAYLEYGTNWSDRVGDLLSYVYPRPLIVDRLPNAKGRTWSNSATASIYENEAVGTDGATFSAQRFYKANGTYTETATYPAGYFSPSAPADDGQIQENADGSGYYSVPIYGAGDIVYGSPTRTGITYEVYTQASPGPTASPVVKGTVAAWYPRHPTLYSESDVDNGVKPIPSNCGSSAAFGKSGEQLVQTVTRLDTILGFTEATTRTTYLASGYGVLCLELKDVQTSYYDFAGDTQFIFYAQPYQVTTTTERLGLQKHGTNVIGGDLRRAQGPQTQPYALAARGAFLRAVERVRGDRERALVNSLHRFAAMQHGGVR